MIINAVDRAFSEFPNSNTIDPTDLLLMSKEVGEGHDTVRTTARTFANAVNNQMEMASLDTDEKTIVDAINELKGTLDALNDVQVKRLVPMNGLTTHGESVEIKVGKIFYYHLGFYAPQNIPVNTILFEGSPHQRAFGNYVWVSNMGNAGAFSFNTNGEVVNGLELKAGNVFTIDFIVI